MLSECVVGEIRCSILGRFAIRGKRTDSSMELPRSAALNYRRPGSRILVQRNVYKCATTQMPYVHWIYIECLPLAVLSMQQWTVDGEQIQRIAKDGHIPSQAATLLQAAKQIKTGQPTEKT